jgi:predicted membrane channel-forming protein YqfA (hemolysin III family)
MSELPLVGTALKPVIDIFFGIGALLMFAELLIAIKRAIAINFSASRILTIIVYGFLFVVCLDWVTGFNFFENTVAPIVWKLLGVTPS